MKLSEALKIASKIADKAEFESATVFGWGGYPFAVSFAVQVDEFSSDNLLKICKAAEEWEGVKWLQMTDLWAIVTITLYKERELNRN